MIALLFVIASQAGDAPPVDDAPLPPPVVEPDSGAGVDGDDDDGADDDDADPPKKKNRRLAPTERDDGDRNDDDDDDEQDDDEDEDDDEEEEGGGRRGSVFWGGATGCAIGGVLPAVGSGLGLGLFYGGSACGDVAGVVGGVSGALIGIPSLLLLGPCAAGGAACGASAGAILSSQDPLTALLWSLPGIGLGVAGGVVASLGVLVSSSTSSEALGEAALPLGTTLVVIGAAASLAAGPLAVAGASLTQEPWEDALKDLGMEDPPLRDGGIEARHVPATASHATSPAVKKTPKTKKPALLPALARSSAGSVMIY